MRISKVRITDHRPRAGRQSPLEADRLSRGGSMAGLDYLEAAQKREAAEHDKAVRDYDPQTVEAAFMDLAGRPVSDRKNPEHRWVMARRAALRRLAVSMRERGIA